jgi:glucosamine kinase
MTNSLNKIGLGIDAGGSNTRWLLLRDDGQTIATGVAEPVNGLIYTPEDKERNTVRFQKLLQDVLQIAKPDAVLGGFTGLHPNTESSALFTKLTADAFGLEPERIYFANDMHIAYAAAFEPGEGVLIYAGTGSVGYHETKTGETISAGGYGYLIDDYGAGYWIGHEAIKYVMRAFDDLGHPSDTPLANAVYKTLGGTTWKHIVSVMYGESPRSTVASLVPAVAEAARQNDEAARAILKRSGQELARLAKVILKRLNASLPVGFMGGISKVSPIVLESLQNELSVPCHIVTTEPVQAAAKLALRKVSS